MTTTPRTTLTIFPQRREAGWVTCAEHQAQRFAVVEVRLRGRIRHERVLLAFPSKAAATRVLLDMQADIARRARKASKRKVLLRSLHLNEYNTLKEPR